MARGMKDKYILHYVQDCEPKLKIFSTKKAYTKFVKDFKESPENDFLDFVVKGKVELILDGHYKKFL